MSKKVSALIFGHNKYAFEVAKNVIDKYNDISIFRLNVDEKFEDDEKYDVRQYDLSDDWSDLEEDYDMQKSIAFCMIDDDAENIFLTISLRSVFKDLTIIALSRNKESANKLSMAGANKVIPVVQTTANIIADMLKKPIVTKVLHSILYDKSTLKIAQIKVEKDALYDGKYPSEIDWHEKHGIIVLSIIHEDMSSEFIYSAKAKHHKIKNGDIFVIVGYEKDIENFELNIGSRCDVNWSNWSR